MLCPQCDAPVPARAEFCPECGTPTSPRLRERKRGRAPDTRTDEEIKNNRKRILVLGAAFLFGFVIGGQSNWFDRGFDFDDHIGDRRPAVVQADQLFTAYREDDEAADDRFDDRFVVVRGEFIEIREDDQGEPDLRLRTSDPAAPLGVDVVGSAHDQARTLRPGQMVTVACDGVSRTGDERWLRNCAIELVEEATVPALPAPASQPTSPAGEAQAPAAGEPAPAAAQPAPAAASSESPSE